MRQAKTVIDGLENLGGWLDADSIDLLEADVIRAVGMPALDAGEVPGWNSDWLRLTVERNPHLLGVLQSVARNWGVAL